MIYSCALPEPLEVALFDHLARADGQEDLCFAIWHPSRGFSRTTALLHHAVLPRDGERDVHGNVAFNPRYFERALGEALNTEGGLAFIHSHPNGIGWQGLSPDDHRAEEGMAAAVLSATGLPLVGLTLGTGDRTWSARFWQRQRGRRRYTPHHSHKVRVVGDRLATSFNPVLAPSPKLGDEILRTRSAWGPKIQANLARLRVGVIGLGSVGSIVAEALARTGIRDVVLLDFDVLKLLNFDRTLNASRQDARLQRPKVSIAARSFRRSATVRPVRVEAEELSLCEELGFRRALDCDILFSCVDRPWPRSVLNFVAYAHLIPVIDGGIHVSRKNNGSMRGAEWKAHIATIGRRCLECLGQYDPGLVSAEREGHLDDPSYIESLPGEHPLRARENVFAFSLAAGSLEVLQMLLMVVGPSGVSNHGAQTYHFVSGSIDLDPSSCDENCPYPSLQALGEVAGHPGTVEVEDVDEG